MASINLAYYEEQLEALPEFVRIERKTKSNRTYACRICGAHVSTVHTVIRAGRQVLVCDSCRGKHDR